MQKIEIIDKGAQSPVDSVELNSTSSLCQRQLLTHLGHV